MVMAWVSFCHWNSWSWVLADPLGGSNDFEFESKPWSGRSMIPTNVSVCVEGRIERKGCQTAIDPRRIYNTDLRTVLGYRV